jgi:hypothetical protein
MRTPNGIQPALAAVLLWLFALSNARAGGSAPLLSPVEPLNFPEGFPPGTNAMYGWTFQLLQPVVVTGVGWYDQGQDGLMNSHEIGLWQGSYYNYTSLVFSATVPAGTTARLDGYWREVGFNVSLTLQPGSYVVAGTRRGPSDDTVEFALAPPDLQATDPRIAADSILPMVWPGGFGPPTEGPILVTGAEFGPMLFVEPIPEAPSSVLLALGLCSWLGVRAGRRRSVRRRASDPAGRHPRWRLRPPNLDADKRGACGGGHLVPRGPLGAQVHAGALTLTTSAELSQISPAPSIRR